MNMKMQMKMKRGQVDMRKDKGKMVENNMEEQEEMKLMMIPLITMLLRGLVKLFKFKRSLKKTNETL